MCNLTLSFTLICLALFRLCIIHCQAFGDENRTFGSSSFVKLHISFLTPADHFETSYTYFFFGDEIAYFGKETKKKAAFAASVVFFF